MSLVILRMRTTTAFIAIDHLLGGHRPELA